MHIRFTRYAFGQMLRKSISPREVRLVIERGQTIREYPVDKPLTSRLILGFVDDRPLRVVAA